MSAAYYLDAVYVMLLDSARSADMQSSFTEKPTAHERELKRALSITDIVAGSADTDDGPLVAGPALDDEGFDFSDLPPPGEFIPGVNDVRDAPRKRMSADIIQLRDATERINRKGKVR